MKKLIFIFYLVLLTSIANAQQTLPDEFFGLKFGQAYSFEQIKSHIGGNGTYYTTDNELELNSCRCIGYYFSDVDYLGRNYPTMVVVTLNSNIFVGTLFSYTSDNIPTNLTMDSLYNEISEELSSRYPMADTFSGENGSVTMTYTEPTGNGIMLFRDYYDNEDKEGKEDKEEIISVNYLSAMLLNSAMGINMIPEIQNTFFGLMMGSRQTISSVRSAVSRKGKYLDEGYDSSGKHVTFTNLIFAGRTWDYGMFSISNSGELYWISAYDSLEDMASWADETKEAELTYNLYKEKLDAKYGGESKEEISDEGRTAVYIGNNDMVLILSNVRAKSQDGTYRRYVKLDYIQTAIRNRLTADSDNEL